MDDSNSVLNREVKKLEINDKRPEEDLIELVLNVDNKCHIFQIGPPFTKAHIREFFGYIYERLA